MSNIGGNYFRLGRRTGSRARGRGCSDAFRAPADGGETGPESGNPPEGTRAATVCRAAGRRAVPWARVAAGGRTGGGAGSPGYAGGAAGDGTGAGSRPAGAGVGPYAPGVPYRPPNPGTNPYPVVPEELRGRPEARPGGAGRWPGARSGHAPLPEPDDARSPGPSAALGDMRPPGRPPNEPPGDEGVPDDGGVSGAPTVIRPVEPQPPGGAPRGRPRGGRSGRGAGSPTGKRPSLWPDEGPPPSPPLPRRHVAPATAGEAGGGQGA